MDPQKTMDLLMQAVDEKEYVYAGDLADELLSWMNKGGFSPLMEPNEFLIGHGCDQCLENKLRAIEDRVKMMS